MQKTLIRSKKNRVFFGVAGGLAEYFDIDPTLVRLIFVILTIWSGVGLILYIIGIIAMPEEGENGKEVKVAKKETKGTIEITQKVNDAAAEVRQNMKDRKLTGEQIAGLIILLVGLIFLGQMLFPMFEFGKLWPLILVAIGLVMITGSARRK